MASNNIDWSSPSKTAAFLNAVLKRFLQLIFFSQYILLFCIHLSLGPLYISLWSSLPVTKFHVYYANGFQMSNENWPNEL